MAADESLRPMRLFIAARSRFSEDTMANCVTDGVRQVVVPGAGLDTFSLRNPFANFGVRVFEVDHAATQVWCAPNDCRRYRADARHAEAVDTFCKPRFGIATRGSAR
jgi:hypothetical protein